jgi:hypothetical protein
MDISKFEENRARILQENKPFIPRAEIRHIGWLTRDTSAKTASTITIEFTRPKDEIAKAKTAYEMRPRYHHVAETSGQSAQLEVPTATVQRSRPSQTAATMQAVQLTRTRSQTGRGQKRTNAGATVDPAEQENQPTQGSGSQRPQRHIVPSRRAMEANEGNARHTQHSHHMEIDSDNGT